MKLTAETKRRLARAEKAILEMLWQDAVKEEINPKDLFPALASLYAHLWLKGEDKIFKK